MHGAKFDLTPIRLPLTTKSKKSFNVAVIGAGAIGVDHIRVIFDHFPPFAFFQRTLQKLSENSFILDQDDVGGGFSVSGESGGNIELRSDL